MKRTMVFLSVFAVLFALSACGKEQVIPAEDAATSTALEPSAFSVSETTDIRVPTAETTDSRMTTAKPDSTTGTTAITGDPTKPQATTTVPRGQIPTADDGTTILDVFIITKVSGQYLELHRVIYGNDTEKLLYCCTYGHLDGADDMVFHVGDEVTIRYDREVAETYPLQLTVREIYPAVWN